MRRLVILWYVSHIQLYFLNEGRISYVICQDMLTNVETKYAQKVPIVYINSKILIKLIMSVIIVIRIRIVVVAHTLSQYTRSM